MEVLNGARRQGVKGGAVGDPLLPGRPKVNYGEGRMGPKQKRGVHKKEMIKGSIPSRALFLASKASRRSAGGLASALTIVDMPAAGHRFRPTVAAMVSVASAPAPSLKKVAQNGRNSRFVRFNLSK